MAMKKLVKRLVSGVLMTVMGLSLLPVTASAANLPRGRMNWYTTYQTIDGFGVSQAADVYGDQLYEHNYRGQIMDLMFSKDRGIGLSILRCEVGNGLNMPTINPERDVWDYTAYEPEQWVIRGARNRGVETIMSTVWSPPYWMKTNNRIKLGGWLRKECYQDYATYLANYVKGYRQYHGVNIDVISICNEPEYAAPWQSCLWSGQDITEFLADYLGPTFAQEGLDTQICIG